MALVNEHYLKLKAGYLFPEIGRRVRAFTEANPQAKVIRLGIGDVTCPLAGEHQRREDAARDGNRSLHGLRTEQGYESYQPIIEKSTAPPARNENSRVTPTVQVRLRHIIDISPWKTWWPSATRLRSLTTPGQTAAPAKQMKGYLRLSLPVPRQTLQPAFLPEWNHIPLLPQQPDWSVAPGNS